MNYECLRCGFSHKQKGNVRQHLKNKKICEAKYINCTQEECLEVVEKNDPHLAIKFYKREILKKGYTHKLKQEIQNQEKEIKKLKLKLENKQNEISTNNNFIYLLKEREFMKTNENVYKIGKTSGLRNRMGDYPKGSKICGVFACKDHDKSEKEILTVFDCLFNTREDIGKEYFEGNVLKMTEIISQVVNKNNSQS